MNYLYGDSTPSKLTSNFLEFLRDAIDFSVHAIGAEGQIKEGRKKAKALREEANTELQRLERFLTSVTKGIDAGEKGPSDSFTAECALKLTRAVEEARQATTAAIEQRLSADLGQIEADEIATRKACTKALAALLTPHEPPSTETETSVELGSSGRYEATRTSRSSFGLAWSWELAVADGSALASLLRVERLTPHLEIRAPQLSGWLSKEVKIRPQKLDRLIVTEIADDGSTVRAKLRGEGTASETGFDLELRAKTSAVRMARVGPAGDESVGAFDVQKEDQEALVALAEKLRAAAVELAPKKLVSATFESTDFETLPSFVEFVQHMVAMMAPIVREISERSLTTSELVIRRLLSNDRREEIFVAKSTLREKYASLDDGGRAVFFPLGIEPHVARVPTAEFPVLGAAAVASAASGTSGTSAASGTSGTPTTLAGAAVAPIVRAELPRSKPPPPPPSTSRNAAARPASSGAIATPAPVTDGERISMESIIEVTDAEPVTENGKPVPPSSPDIQTASLSAALKKITMLSRNGRVDDAHGEYASLFSSTAFADAPADDQRKALKLLVFADRPSTGDAVVQAHRAALGRLDALATAEGEPADYEMVGMAQIVLGNTSAARTAFSTALTRERARDASSELCGSLTRRLAALDGASKKTSKD